MASTDLFGNTTFVETTTKKEVVQNDNLNLFNVSVPETPVEEEPTNELGVQVRQNQGESGATVNVSPVYFGKSFEFLGPWEIGRKYYNDDHRTSFISYSNCLLACNKTHESSIGTKPVILYDGDIPIGVENIYWTIALTSEDLNSDITSINSTLLGLKKIISSNSESITSVNGILNVVGLNMNDLLKRTENLETSNTKNEQDIKNIQNTLDASIVYPVVLTEDEYEALAVKDPNKFYYIYEE